MTELKPCPFCGGIPKKIDTFNVAAGHKLNFAYVECSHCGASARPYHESITKNFEERAIEAWNRRADE